MPVEIVKTRFNNIDITSFSEQKRALDSVLLDLRTQLSESMDRSTVENMEKLERHLTDLAIFLDSLRGSIVNLSDEALEENIFATY